MGKKKIEKAPKTAKVEEDDHSEPEPDQVQPQNEESPKKKATSAKPGRKGKAKQDQKVASTDVVKDIQLFPEEFLKKIEDFKTFYRSYLQLKITSDDVEISGEFKKVSDEVKRKITTACSKVLREDVSEAEKWIENKKSAIRDQIRNVENAEADTRSALEKSGTFTESEIESQLAGIRQKKANLQKSIGDLEKIQESAVEIYKAEGGMDEQ